MHFVMGIKQFVCYGHQSAVYLHGIAQKWGVQQKLNLAQG